MRLLLLIAVLSVTACSSQPQNQAEYLAGLPLTIDQPTAPFPYNSRICP